MYVRLRSAYREGKGKTEYGGCGWAGADEFALLCISNCAPKRRGVRLTDLAIARGAVVGLRPWCFSLLRSLERKIKVRLLLFYCIPLLGLLLLLASHAVKVLLLATALLR